MGGDIDVYLTRHACMRLNERAGLSKSDAEIVQNLNQGIDTGLLSKDAAIQGIYRLYLPQMGFAFVLVERPPGYVAKTAMCAYDDNKDPSNLRKEREVGIRWFGPEELEELERGSSLPSD
jgi:hypothetical protein